MEEDRHGKPRIKPDDFGEGELYEKYKELYRHQHHLFKELQVATQAQIDALDAATQALTASTQASVTATDALVAAVGAGTGGSTAADGVIDAATTAQTDAKTALDAATQRANTASGTQGSEPLPGTEQAARADLKAKFDAQAAKPIPGSMADQNR